MNYSFKTINFKIAYNSDVDNILTDFYIPALSGSVFYKRIGGYFSSAAFALAARGLSKFIENNGHMQLIINHVLQRKDKEVLEEMVYSPAKIETDLLNEINSWDLEDKIIKDHAGALGWMLINDLLELKIAISDDMTIFHQKVGILEDVDGNKLSFSGSNNESASGWKSNIEEFKVFRSWVPDQNQYVETDRDKFDAFWRGSSKRFIVMDAPIAIRKKLIEIAPKKLEDIHIDISLTSQFFSPASRSNFPSERTIELRDFQREAVKSWVNNGYKGILEMATGTGKTLTALGCLNQAIGKHQKVLVVISAPYNHLLSQWNNELKGAIRKGGEEDFKSLFSLTQDNFLTIGSSNYSWKRKLTNKLLDLNNNLLDRLIIFTTHDSLSSDFLLQKLLSTNIKMFLIVDEVHGIGAPVRKNGLLHQYTIRLGLSATPRRWMDDIGSKVIFDFFDKTVFEFSLEKAINTINSLTGKTYLTPYDYLPYFTTLTDDEAYKYIELTKKIGKLFKYKQNKSNYQKQYDVLMQKRANIIKLAENKLSVFEDIMEDLQNKYGFHRDILVYCHQQSQLELLQGVLNKKMVRYQKFTGEESTSERESILNNFKEGLYQVLTSMKCLDEGVDIPSAKIAIMIASSTNPREFIQRRGRILRYFEGKNKSYIFDIIVMPPKLTGIDENMRRYETGIYKREMARYKEFARIADNSSQCLLKLIRAEEEYGIYA